jgi:hypothetical protein
MRCLSVGFDSLITAPIFAVARSGELVHRPDFDRGRWLVRAPSNHHPDSCAIVRAVSAVDEPAWLPRRLLPPSATSCEFLAIF